MNCARARARCRQAIAHCACHPPICPDRMGLTLERHPQAIPRSRHSDSHRHSCWHIRLCADRGQALVRSHLPDNHHADDHRFWRHRACYATGTAVYAGAYLYRSGRAGILSVIVIRPALQRRSHDEPPTDAQQTQDRQAEPALCHLRKRRNGRQNNRLCLEWRSHPPRAISAHPLPAHRSPAEAHTWRRAGTAQPGAQDIRAVFKALSRPNHLA